MRALLIPVAVAIWIWRRICYYRKRTKKIIISGNLSCAPVTRERVILLISQHVIERGKVGEKWEIPLVEEIQKAVAGREKEYEYFIWALDYSRSWTAYRPSDGKDCAIRANEFFSHNAPEMKFYVHAVRIVHSMPT